MSSLWGEEFSVSDKNETKKILKKIKEPKKPKLTTEKIINSRTISDKDKLVVIEKEVYRVLGSFKKDTEVIKDINSFITYIDECINNNIVAVDTETNNSLDPLTCKLMGLCLYTPGQKNAYIPVNHVNIDTKEKFSWQITEEQIYEQLSRLIDTKLIFHNAKFDCEVLKCTCGCDLIPYWDTQPASRILNENESARLKDQYRLKIDPSQEKYDIEHLFKGIEYAVVDPELFALYAATDSYLTFKLYEWQIAQFKKPENSRIYKLYTEVELPVIPVFTSMELRGISIDEEYTRRLSVKYHNKLNEVSLKIDKEIENLRPQINNWRKSEEANYRPPKKNNSGEGKSKNEQLEETINLGSPTQLAILLYDVLNVGIVDKQNPRGTGEDILEELSKDVPLCKLLIERRSLSKLIDAFIDTLPEQRSKRDNKIHCSYNPIGADTGRVSCSNPNLQQIPSKNKEIRMIFKADDGKVFVGSDFSQQEPRLLAAYSQDERMINSYKDDKDLYAVMGQAVYHNNYEDNLEHYPDGSKYEAGTKRRKAMKSVLLGIMYGMGAKALSERIGETKEEAQKIIDNFYSGFPKVKKFISDGENQVKSCGYVEDLWGRRRRLPNATLPEWQAETIVTSSEFNPLLYVTKTCRHSEFESVYLDKIKQCTWKKDRDRVKSEALSKGVKLINNSNYISKAMRQCTNARIQGSASTMTKKAMIQIHNDQIMNDLGFELLVTVHDELIGQCPKENAEKVAERLSYLMSNCVPELNMPFKCDAEIESSWYINSYISAVKKEYKDLCKTYSTEEAFNSICNDHIECTRNQLQNFISS